MQQEGAGRWDVTVAAPRYFHGQRDLRPAVLDFADDEPAPLIPLRAYLTRRVHLFVYGRRLRSVLRGGWDMIHCWEEPYVLAGLQVAAWVPARTPFVFRTAQSLPKRYPPPFNWAERYCLRRAAGWICSGRLVAENLLARPGYASRPMARIPLGVDLSAFRPDPAAGEAVRRSLDWDAGGPPVVGYLGRFVPEKGLSLLMRALDAVTTPWRALLVGGGLMEPALRNWAARHADRVRVVTGVPHDKIPAYLNAMDLLAAPSQTTPRWREQFGRMLVEAFACGVPVVGSDSGEVPFVIADAGLVLPEHDEAAWSRGLAELLDNPARRAELAERGRGHAQQFAWPAVARKHLEFFESVLGTTAER
jgi:glycosyltransferase involved in cell wall biosynthesis